MTRRALAEENEHLRQALQACQSRTRLALRALSWLHERLLALGLDRFTVEDMGEIALRLDHLAVLLSGEEVSR
jgi:hypothetical protein